MCLWWCHVVVLQEKRTSASSLSILVKVQLVECLHTADWKKGDKKKIKPCKVFKCRILLVFSCFADHIHYFWGSVSVYNFCKEQTELPVHFQRAPCWIVPISLCCCYAADSAVLNCSLDHSICMQHKCKLSCLRVKLKHVCITWID